MPYNRCRSLLRTTVGNCAQVCEASGYCHYFLLIKKKLALTTTIGKKRSLHQTLHLFCPLLPAIVVLVPRAVLQRKRLDKRKAKTGFRFPLSFLSLLSLPCASLNRQLATSTTCTDHTAVTFCSFRCVCCSRSQSHLLSEFFFFEDSAYLCVTMAVGGSDEGL